MEVTLRFDERGVMHAVYDDDLVPVFAAVGTVSVRRASHVEPAPSSGWLADMSPVDGPVLGPFALRTEALAAERQWLAEHLGL